jgi:hypothetical protein
MGRQHGSCSDASNHAGSLNGSGGSSPTKPRLRLCESQGNPTAHPPPLSRHVDGERIEWQFVILFALLNHISLVWSSRTPRPVQLLLLSLTPSALFHVGCLDSTSSAPSHVHHACTHAYAHANNSKIPS